MVYTYNSEKIIEALTVWFQPDDVFEVRILDAVSRAYYRPHLESGYFTYDTRELVPQAMSHILSAKGVYVTANPVKKELLNRAVNRIRPAGREPTTSDDGVLCRRWLLIDCDAKRASGIPSSDDEHQLAAEKAQEIRSGLASMGWPEPIVTDSGNGAQLMYRIDLPACDNGLVKCVVEAVSAVSSDAVDIDVTVHNASRIWRLPGTMNCKGDSTSERPHRMASIVSIPANLKVVPSDLLRDVASCSAPADAGVAQTMPCKGDFDLDSWISEHCNNIKGPFPWNGGRKWVFDVCPFNGAHSDRSAVITQLSKGAISFRCHHNGCAGKGWHELRDLIDGERSLPTFTDCPAVNMDDFFSKIADRKAKRENPYDDPGPIPHRLLSIPGIIDNIVAINLATAPYPNRVLAFTGALSLVAHLAGRKFRDRRNNFTNIYVIALANSGTGKDHPRKVNMDIALLAGIHQTVSDSFASGAGLEDSMYTCPSQLFQMDEVDWLFNTLKNSKDAAMSESINEKLLKFYSSSNSIYCMRKKAIAPGTQLSDKTSPGSINNPCLNLFGTAVPDYFYEALSRRVLENGLVARCIIVEADSRGRHGTPRAIRPMLDGEFMQQINAIAGRTVPENLLGVPDPVEMSETREATELFDKYCNECDDRYAGFEKLHDLAAMALWARAMEKTFKLAMVYAVSVCPDNPVIDTDAVRWAFAFVCHMTHKMLFRAGQYCYESSSDKMQKRFLKAIHDAGGKMRHCDLLRKLHINAKEMKDIADSLLESEQIRKDYDHGSGRTVIVYEEA